MSSVKISFTHIFTIWNSSSVNVFVSSLGHLSGLVLLPAFKHVATYFFDDTVIIKFHIIYSTIDALHGICKKLVLFFSLKCVIECVLEDST